MRTPSERSRARSLDDLSKSGEEVAQCQHGAQLHHLHGQLGSDNGLDKMEWQSGFTPVSLQSHWHSLAGPASSVFAHPLDMLDPPDHHRHGRDEDEVFLHFRFFFCFVWSIDLLFIIF